MTRKKYENALTKILVRKFKNNAGEFSIYDESETKVKVFFQPESNNSRIIIVIYKKISGDHYIYSNNDNAFYFHGLNKYRIYKAYTKWRRNFDDELETELVRSIMCEVSGAVGSITVKVEKEDKNI